MLSIDIPVHCFIRYYNKDGDEVTSCGAISKHYLRSVQFYIDLLVCLPLEYFDIFQTWIVPVRMIKLLKFKLLSNWINKLNLGTQSKSIIKVCAVIFGLCIFILTITSIWLRAVHFNCTWFTVIE